jgi:Rieske Fe-S protein
MSSSTFGRRRFLLGSGVGLGALLVLPKGAARAESNKIAIPLAKVQALKAVGGSVVLKVKDKSLLLVRDGATSVRAFNPVCTHRQCVVAYSAGEKKIKCSCHSSLFDLAGHVLSGPAPRPLQVYPAELAGEQIIVTL